MMDLPCNQKRDQDGIIRIILTMLVMARFTVADMANPGSNYDCQKGCRRTFKPVCGEDGRTYSNECVATCQDVQVARAGPCPGERLLHPDNKHVVTGAEGGPTSSSSSSPEAGLITRQHLHAFRHEGFRYAGQMRFTGDMQLKGHAQQQQQQQEPGSAAAATAGASGSLGQEQHRNGFNAVRITREGHVYMADMDENVDRVLELLIQHHKADGAAAATATATNGIEQQQQQQQQASSAHALLHSLQHWRNYRSSARRSGGTNKWSRHTIIPATSGPADHVLQPGLDVAAAAAAVFAAQGPSSPSSPDSPAATAASGAGSRDGDRDVKGRDYYSPRQLQEEGEEGGQEEEEEEEGFFPWVRVLGGPIGGRDKQQQQQGQRQRHLQSSGRGDRGESVAGRGAAAHRQVRRSLGVFDLDDRVDCPRTPTYPFTAVGQINIRDYRGNYVCSGALVGPDVVLTAGHCVFSRVAEAFYERLEFSPARYRTLDGQVVNPFGTIPWRDVTLYEGYSSKSVPDANIVDLAVIGLSERIGLRAGWMGVFEPCSPYAPNRYVALTAGYPSDKPSGSCKTTQCVVVQEPCTDGYLYHKCDTAAGQSGSPMYMMAMTAGRKMGPYIRGVHNLEWVRTDDDGKSYSYINSAVSITPDHYRSVLAWIGLSFTTNDTAPMGPALPPTDYMTGITGS